MIQILATFVSGVVFALAGLHIYWGHGGLWPGKNYQELVDKVFGQGTRFPSIYACYFVACCLSTAGFVLIISVFDLFGDGLDPYLSMVNYFVSVVFFLRGIGGYLPIIEKKWNEAFIYNNRKYYGPICIGLGIAYTILATKS